jgi:hypothetical protein
MANNEHRLMSTPVSVNDGFKRSDGRTWAVLGACVIVAGLVVLAINLFVPKQKLHWPTSPVPQQVTAPPAQDVGQDGKDEPKTYDVAPPSRPRHRG